MGFQKLIDIGDMLGRDQRLQILGRHRVFALVIHFIGDQQVDAIGLAVDVFVDPIQLDLKGLRGVADRAKHAETAGFRDLGHHIAAMAKGEQRKINAQFFTQR